MTTWRSSPAWGGTACGSPSGATGKRRTRPATSSPTITSISPIQLYGSNWPDALGDTTAPGFGRRFGKGRMGVYPPAVAAQVKYLRQILNHVNPYTHIVLKDEPA